jgi:hypothetical protein
MVSFTCHHVMHEECYYELNIKKNKNNLCPLCFTGTDSSLMVGEAKPLRYRLEIDESQLLRGQMNKMNYYDRTAQMAAMESWNRFEEWVDL